MRHCGKVEDASKSIRNLFGKIYGQEAAERLGLEKIPFHSIHLALNAALWISTNPDFGSE